MLNDYKNIKQNRGVVSLADKLEFGEIYSPFSLIEQMLDLFEPAVFTDPDKTWLDPGAGQGYFSLVLFHRLNHGLKNKMPEDLNRQTHILKKMLYLCEIKPSNIAILRTTFGSEANIWPGDFLQYGDTPSTPTPHGDTRPRSKPSTPSPHGDTRHGDTRPRQRSKSKPSTPSPHGDTRPRQRSKSKPSTPTPHSQAPPRLLWPAQFDYIIGNPPYNINGRIKVPTNKQEHKKNDGQTIWPAFIKKAVQLLPPETGQLCFIVPSIWLKPDLAQMYFFLLAFKIEKMRCFTSNETNTIFQGEAQTPTCFFLLTNKADNNNKSLKLYDKDYQTFIDYPFNTLTRLPLPLSGAQIIKKLIPFIYTAGPIHIKKTNSPPTGSTFQLCADSDHPFPNITTCHLQGLQPHLIINYSNKPQFGYGIRKLVLAHKMYGFPYYDETGVYGISSRDNYVLCDKTPAEMVLLKAFLSSKLAFYIYDATRYRMKYLEKYAFELLPDITQIPALAAAGLNAAALDAGAALAAAFGLDDTDQAYIQARTKKNYKTL